MHMYYFFVFFFICCIFYFNECSNEIHPSNVNIYQYDNFQQEIRVIKSQLQQYINHGNFKEVIKITEELENMYGTLALDLNPPNLYLLKGIAYHGLHLIQEAANIFENGLLFYPDDTRLWINLGEMKILSYKFNDSIAAYESAYERGEIGALARLLAAKGWVDSWKHFEYIASEIEKEANLCRSSRCNIESAFGLEYTDTPSNIAKLIHKKAPYTSESTYLIHPLMRSMLYKNISQNFRRLKVGIISSDFGVHPVSSLVRGVLQLLDKRKIDLFCFSVTNDLGWWGYNISNSVEHFEILSSINTQDGATIIASNKIDILIDLNGHTKNSGLSYLSHRPAPIQMSFLGLPTTTAATFVDYYIGDTVALPPEFHDHFTEKLILMRQCYIANDYAQMQGDVVLRYSGKDRAPRRALDADIHITSATMLFGTISNSQKLDPSIFQVWTNILRQVDGSKFVMTNHSGVYDAMQNLKVYGKYFGISSERVGLVPLAPWIDHIYRKTAFDVLFDTATKNGHTTGLDGIWAGVPVVSLGNGNAMPTRAAESIASSLENDVGITYSLKEYEDFVIKMCTSNYSLSNYVATDKLYDVQSYKLLKAFRSSIQRSRVSSHLYDTYSWTQEFMLLLQATWDVTNIAAKKYENLFSHQFQQFTFGGITMKSKHKEYTDKVSVTPDKFRNYHIFSIHHKRKTIDTLKLEQVYDTQSEIFPRKHNIDQVIDTSSKIEMDGVCINCSVGYDNNAIKVMEESSQSTLIPTKDDSLKLDDLLNQKHHIFLNIGGIVRSDEWTNVNVVDQPFKGLNTSTDFIRSFDDLYGFPNRSVSAIYCSHNLEHTSIGKRFVFKTLQEWNRVLKPGGLVFISVPDLSVLARLYLSADLKIEDKWLITLMIYGSQSSVFDYHKIGFDESILSAIFEQSGFCDIQRVESFNLFQDASVMEFHDTKISLNIIAKKCIITLEDPDNISIQHKATPFSANN